MVSLNERVTLNTATFSGDGGPVEIRIITKGIMVDNYSGFWLKVGNEPLYVPPLTTGWANNFYSRVQGSIAIRKQPPPGATQGATADDGDVIVSAYEDEITPFAGTPLQGLTVTPVPDSSPSNNIHKDVTIAAAGTTVLWTPATGKRVVIACFLISTDTAMRVALVDDSDVAGQRIAAPYLGALGGMIRTAPFVSGAKNRVIKVVTGLAGNVFVEADGYETT